MTSYFLRRLLLLIPTFLGITVMVFTITRFVPGGPVERMVAAYKKSESMQGRGSLSSESNEISEEQLQQLKEFYGFDKPVFASYLDWLGKVLRLDLGMSSRYNEPVWDIIKSKLFVSSYYGFLTMILTYLVCIPLGIWKAVRHNSAFDNFSSMVIFIGYAIPGFVVGITCIVFFASELGWFPLGGFVSDDFDNLSLVGKLSDLVWHSILPLTAYMVGSFAIMTFLMKNSLLDNLAADYVRTAIAKGVPFRKAVLNHAFRNSVIPLATHFGNNISFFITGSFLIEKIFDIDGFGLLGYESILERDYPVVLGILVISCLLQLIGNILSDVCVALVDPRVQFK